MTVPILSRRLPTIARAGVETLPIFLPPHFHSLMG